MGKERKKYEMEFIFGITLLSVAFFLGFQTIQIGREWKECEPGIVITIKMVVLTVSVSMISVLDVDSRTEVICFIPSCWQPSL